MPLTETERREQWRCLYERLLVALTPIGENDPQGRGDYWLMDDDWNDTHQKLCVTRENFWSEVVQNTIQSVLLSGFDEWGVYVVFEGSPGRRSGFIVYRDAVSDEPRS